MSSYTRIHKFCTADGTVIYDETISFASYLELEDPEQEPETTQGGTTETSKADGADDADNADGAETAKPDTASPDKKAQLQKR